MTPDLTLADLHAQVQALTARLATLEAQQPLEPLYSMAEAATLLPCSLHTLRRLLTRNRHRLQPPLYRWDQLHRSHRLLRVADLTLLRSVITRRTRQHFLRHRALNAEQAA